MSLYTELWARIGQIGKDIGGVSKKINELSLASMTDSCSIERTGRDSNGIFSTTEWKRIDGTLAKSSVLSVLDGNNRYTRRTETYYGENGTTILVTRVFSLGYNSFGQIITETLG